jgi:hypothetical protein
MIPHQLTPHCPERFVHRGDLHHDLGTVAIVLDHLLGPAHLPLDAPEALEVAILYLGINPGRFAAGSLCHFASAACGLGFVAHENLRLGLWAIGYGLWAAALLEEF